MDYKHHNALVNLQRGRPAQSEAVSHWLGRGLILIAAYGATNMKDPAKKSSRAPRPAAEDKLDEEIEELFPASDPPANTPTSAGGPERPRRKRSAKPKPGRPG